MTAAPPLPLGTLGTLFQKGAPGTFPEAKRAHNQGVASGSAKGGLLGCGKGPLRKIGLALENESMPAVAAWVREGQLRASGGCLCAGGAAACQCQRWLLGCGKSQPRSPVWTCAMDA
jgi:hypothetical protein